MKPLLQRPILSVFLATLFLSIQSLFAQQAISLMKPGEKNLGWTFVNGQEFPGAKGGLLVDPAAKRGGQDSLKITGDFTEGGLYVAANLQFDPVDPREISFWAKNIETENLTIRLGDSSGRTHQFKLKVQPSTDWQRIVFPVEQFFNKTGESAGGVTVAKYEAFGGGATGGGKNDGKWAGPAKAFSVVVTSNKEKVVRNLWINGLSMIAKSAESSAAAAGEGSDSKGMAKKVQLDEVIEGESLWKFSIGKEVPGGAGAMTLVKDDPTPGKHSMKMEGDFTAGGNYVVIQRKTETMALGEVNEISMKLKATNFETIIVRLVDASGQSHQKRFKVVADGAWHPLAFKPTDVAGGEHWGGANDGKWQSPMKMFCISLVKPKTGEPKASLQVAEVNAEVTVATKVNKAAFQSAFEEAAPKPANWTVEGNVAIDPKEAFKGSQSLVLTLPENNVRQKTAAVGPSFPVATGPWEVKLAAKTDLVSMDSSYNGMVTLEYLDGSGKAVGQSILVEFYNKKNWQPVVKQVEIPSGVVSARFVAKINKETPGKFWVDEISASALVSTAKQENIQRLTFTSVQVGNLLLPQDSKVFTLTALAGRPMPPEDCNVVCVLRDYWGAEQAKPIAVTLSRKEKPKVDVKLDKTEQKDAKKEKDYFVYEGKVDLAGQPIEIGRYYELHAEIARKEGDPFRNYTSFAVLPEAPANSCKAEEVPFTSRNWDNRFPEFVYLTKRLGVRVVGGYTNWNFKPPYKVKLNQDKYIQEMGLGVLSTTMAMQIEGRRPDWQKWDENALRENIRNFLTTYKDIRPLIINLGNEPHSKGDEVKVEIEAYRILYTEIKKFDPSIYVVGTSVGVGNEDYFKNGFGQWCDAYDFHVYETAEKVRNILEVKYPEMFAKYGHAKPIWSTELGLNSQGMKRQTVAGELTKKFTNFFAGGGANVSWFGLLYPDPDGSKAKASGAAHNVFDCRYEKYAPKLDAVAYYNAVNGIAIKKYATDKVYGDRLNVFLFRDRDDQALQVLYKSKGREDVFLPLPGVGEVQEIRIDGRRSMLHAGNKGLTLTVDEDPVLLLYKGGEKTLPKELGKAAVSIAAPPASIVSGQPMDIDVAVNDSSAASVELVAPPFWKVTKSSVSGGNRFTVVSPEGSTVREADMRVVVKNGAGQICGDVILRPQVTGMISMQVLAVSASKGKPVGAKLIISNNGPEAQEVTWDASIVGEQVLHNGVFSAVASTDAYFSETPSGAVKLAPRESTSLFLPLSEVNPLKLYRLSASVRDATGRTLIVERPMGGFVGVPKVTQPLKMDGVLDEKEWEKAPTQILNTADQFYVVMKKQKPTPSWDNPEDLSAAVKFLWDDQYLYVSAKVTDDIWGKPQRSDMLWFQDGIQLLIDGDRASALKKGKSDYAMGLGINGPQAWCALASDPSVSPGEAKDIKIAAVRKDEKTGAITYEMAIPWTRLVPFKAQVGANLGVTVAFNEDDGPPGRDSYITWFGSVQTKDVDTAGDLILLEAGE